MKLATINGWMRKVGFVLVVVVGDEKEPDRPIEFRVMRAKKFDDACMAAAAKKADTWGEGSWG